VSNNLPFYLLFGVIMAILLAGVFFMQLTRQREFEVDTEAQALADELAKGCFLTLPRQQSSVGLPLLLAGSSYELEVDENRSTFIVHVTSGVRKGESYMAVADVELGVENADFEIGGKIYFQRRGGAVIVSAAPISAPSENVKITPLSESPEFYHFAKENQREAAAIIAVYFDTSQDIDAYKWENNNSILVHAGSILLRVQGYENEENVGLVDNAWIISNIENYTGDLMPTVSCPSAEDAHSSGWLYSPQQTLDYLRMRTWRRTSDNVVVEISRGASIRAAAVTTNVSTCPTRRITFDNYVMYYRAVPWWYLENTPGFVLQSDPELEAIA